MKEFPLLPPPDQSVWLTYVNIAGDDDDAHASHPPDQGAPHGVPGAQHGVQDAKQEGEGEFTQEICQEAGSERPWVLLGCGPVSYSISAAAYNHCDGCLLAR